MRRPWPALGRSATAKAKDYKRNKTFANRITTTLSPTWSCNVTKICAHTLCIAFRQWCIALLGEKEFWRGVSEGCFRVLEYSSMENSKLLFVWLRQIPSVAVTLPACYLQASPFIFIPSVYNKVIASNMKLFWRNLVKNWGKAGFSQLSFHLLKPKSYRNNQQDATL